jgi:microcystin-dependent protein
MTISAKHAFQSEKGDPSDTTLVRPSNWNDEHDITLASDSLLGRDSSGAGDVQEIPCTALGRAIISAADIAALAAAGFGVFTTGDVKPTLKTVADTGWVMADDGTVGNGSSSATNRANADVSALYAVLWAIPNTYAPVTGGRGVSAAADFAAGKPIALTKMLGRALASAGAGSGLTSRDLGSTVGEETHTLTAAESAELTYESAVDEHGGHAHLQRGVVSSDFNTGNPALANGATTINSGANTASATTGITVATTSDAEGGAHNNMQPTSFVNFMVKL